MIGQFSVAAATAVVGYDLAMGQVWQRSSRHRVLRGVALKGSAAAVDTKCDILVDTVKVGEAYNTSTGFPNLDDLMPFRNFVPAGSDIHLYVTDAPATNPINGIVSLDDL